MEKGHEAGPARKSILSFLLQDSDPLHIARKITDKKVKVDNIIGAVQKVRLMKYTLMLTKPETKSEKQSETNSGKIQLGEMKQQLVGEFYGK